MADDHANFFIHSPVEMVAEYKYPPEPTGFTCVHDCYWCDRRVEVKFDHSPDDPWAELPDGWSRVHPVGQEFCSVRCLVVYFMGMV